MGTVVNEEEGRNLLLLNATAKMCNKLTYIFWIWYFGKGEGHRKGVMVEALLSVLT